ncbi:DUF6286 domain-containing protein [Streptomyces sp. NRRL F-5630]|uniref:DUF6286 domain-containing protein n=1 Tax=Streptomyces sp. NRRL F-5630 TaxID=1463864 RepID=UPI003D75FB22
MSTADSPRPPVLEKTGSHAAPRPLPDPDAPPVTRAGRFWSARRVPAVLLALVLTGASGLFLYDVVAVRAGHSAMSWRKDLAQGLAEHRLDNTWVLVGAGIAAALGLWLLFLALTPGRRRLLPMRRPYEGVRGGLDREAAAMVVRDRATQVSGVRSAHVSVRRRKVKVRALAHFRDLDQVRAELSLALGSTLTELGLARTPRLVVRVRRPGKD